MNNSQLPGDHIVAGSFETAARVRQRLSLSFSLSLSLSLFFPSSLTNISGCLHVHIYMYIIQCIVQDVHVRVHDCHTHVHVHTTQGGILSRCNMYTFTRVLSRAHTQLLHEQVGVVNFEPYKQLFMLGFSRGRSIFSGIPLLPPLYGYPHRNW